MCYATCLASETLRNDVKFKHRKRRYASSCNPASFADARQAGGRITGKRNMDFRTEMGWISCPGVSRRGRDPDSESRRKIADSLLPGTPRAAPLAVARPLRA